jgi:hypothetical protein
MRCYEFSKVATALDAKLDEDLHRHLDDLEETEKEEE